MIKNNVEHSAISVLWMSGRGGRRWPTTTSLKHGSTPRRAVMEMVAEPWDLDFSRKVQAEVNDAFADHLESGLLEVITPHSSFYPNLDNLKAGP